MAKLLCGSLPQMPWQPRPSGCTDPVWRDSRNPVIARDVQADANSIFNSAVVPFADGFAGVFRCDDRARRMNLFAGFSKDGRNWEIDDVPLQFQAAPGVTEQVTALEYRYDPRVIPMEGKYYICWCNGYHGPTIGLGYTEDFQTFYQLENALLPYNRNGTLFPRRIGGRYRLLSRPSDTGHTAFGDIFLSESEDLVHWGKHRFVMGPAPFERSAWQCLKIGAGPPPIETDLGWLLFYHGVLRSCNGYVYSFGAALLDREEPERVLLRTQPYLLSPQAYYECVGDVPNVVFPTAALCDGETGRIAIYYGCADTVTGLCYTELEPLLHWMEQHQLNTGN
jgi:beta-1,4-mannooligosaccharide/beta-1,4-mannosyl-N-acetylglucosamine phosphorylase